MPQKSLAFLIVLPLSLGMSVGGVSFPESVETDGRSLSLKGVGVLEWGFLIDLYAGAFYAPPGVAVDAVLGEVPRRLEIEYFRAIEAGIFRRSTAEGIRRNVDATVFERLGPAIEQVNRLYRDVEPGDRYALTYVPGLGTRLALNGETLGTVAGVEFGTAIFSIWLGRDPLDADLRRALLGLE